MTNPMRITWSRRALWKETTRSAHVTEDDRDLYEVPDVAAEFQSLHTIVFHVVIDAVDWWAQFNHIHEVADEENQ